jgi:hypothetical protein
MCSSPGQVSAHIAGVPRCSASSSKLNVVILRQCPHASQRQKLEALVVDSESSPLAKRVYSLGLDEFVAWYPQGAPARIHKAAVGAWRVAWRREAPARSRSTCGSPPFGSWPLAPAERSSSWTYLFRARGARRGFLKRAARGISARTGVRVRQGLSSGVREEARNACPVEWRQANRIRPPSIARGPAFWQPRLR